MPLPSNTPLAALVHHLMSARHRADVHAAKAALYEAVLPAHLRTCATLVENARGDVWLSAEDLAQDSLSDALDQLRAGACRSLKQDGLLRWLHVVAERRLGRASGRRKAGAPADVLPLDEELVGPAPTRDAVEDEGPTSERAVRRREYARALAELAPEHARTWVVVVEQEVPPIAAAAQLAVHRETVRRRVASARAHLATRLAHWTY